MSAAVRDDISFDFRDARVLMVDQSQGFLDVTAQILLGFGFKNFNRYTNLEHIVDGKDSRIHDLVLIDPYPDCDGAMAFIKDLRRRDAASGEATLVIVVTGKPGHQVVDAARTSGADYVVAKPFSPKVLLDRILWIADPKANRDIVDPADGAGRAGQEPLQ